MKSKTTEQLKTQLLEEAKDTIMSCIRPGKGFDYATVTILTQWLDSALSQIETQARAEGMADANEDWHNLLNQRFSRSEIYEGIKENILESLKHEK